ncbi:MAG: hypothetical protein V1916_02805, partial [Patescibacteria group bacterium]
MAIPIEQGNRDPMAELTYTDDKLLIFDPGKSRSTCHVFISQQSPVEERNLGRLYLLAEIATADRVNIDIIGAVRDEFRSSYYHTDDLKIETAFEKALERVNQRIADMVGDYDTNWLDRFSAVAMVIKNDTLYLSAVGKLHVFLIRGGRITSILDSTETPTFGSEPINPLKAFSNVISGTLQTDDTVLTCTPSLLDYISQEKLKRMVSENAPQRAVSLLDSLLQENVGHTAFAALIVT